MAECTEQHSSPPDVLDAEVATWKPLSVMIYSLYKGQYRYPHLTDGKTGMHNGRGDLPELISTTR